MVKIKLQRVGAKKKPSYRLVVADSRSPRDGAFIEIIGHYDPLTDPGTIVIQQERVLDWLGRGAQPTQTVATLLGKAGVSHKLVTAFSRKTTDRKTLKKSERKAAAQAKPAAAPESKAAKASEVKPAPPPESKAAKASEAKPAAAPESKAAKASEAKPAPPPKAKAAKASDTEPASPS
jgi:small subunit ribosomal protein S16